MFLNYRYLPLIVRTCAEQRTQLTWLSYLMSMLLVFVLSYYSVHRIAAPGSLMSMGGKCGVAGVAMATPISKLVWRRHTNFFLILTKHI